MNPLDEEGLHTPGDEHWWNESWYFDFAQDGFGGYVRVGMVPNQDACWYLLHLVTPDSVVRIDDKTAALPDATLTVHGIAHTGTGGTWRIAGEAAAEQLTAEDIVNRVEGKPVDISVDLTWTIDGVPFAYDVTTRYEIPCNVTGSVTVNGITTEVDAVGQRDHSWGVRDWKSSTWCWSAARLADGSRLHVTDVVFPGFRFTTGYDDDVTVTGVERTQVIDDLPRTARLVVEPTGRTVDVTTLAHGPTMITDDGKTWPFHRSMARFTTEDGDGLGWIEWNLAPLG